MKTNPLLGLDWRGNLGIMLDEDNIDPRIKHVSEDPDVKTLKRQFKKQFNENHTVKGIKVEMQLKEDAILIQQKRRPIPIHLQQSVEKELQKLENQGHIEKANDIDGNCFVSSAVITVKKDGAVKIALNSRKLNEITVKRKAQRPNMEKLISRISRKIAKGVSNYPFLFLEKKHQRSKLESAYSDKPQIAISGLNIQ